MEHTPGPWHACGSGDCPCKQIWAEDGPVATAESGAWGDSYPVLEIEGHPTSVQASVTIKPAMRLAEYGSLDPEVAAANARLIAAAPDLLDACNKVMAWWTDVQNDTTGPYGEYNVYDDEPAMVVAARAAIAKATPVP